MCSVLPHTWQWYIVCRGIGSLRHISQYPNHLEREAMILSSFAGMLLVRISNQFQQHLCFCPQAVSLFSHFQNNLPIEDILSLYNCKPVASYPYNHAKVCYSIYYIMFVTWVNKCLDGWEWDLYTSGLKIGSL